MLLDTKILGGVKKSKLLASSAACPARQFLIGVVVLACLGFSTALSAIDDPQSDEAPDIFVVDRGYLSGNGLPKVDFKDDPDRIHFQKRLFRGENLSVYALSSETRLNIQDNFLLDEFIYYLNGRADVDLGSVRKTFLAGDYIFAPKGWSGTWYNRGGPDLNLELSVISTKRSKAIAEKGAKVPVLLDRLALSGLKSKHNDNLPHQVPLHAGAELVITLEEDIPGTRTIKPTEADELFHVLRGQVTIEPTGKPSRDFFYGDFFVLPKGFEGTITFTALNRVRLIRIRAQDDL